MKLSLVMVYLIIGVGLNQAEGIVWDCNRPWPSLELFMPGRAIKNANDPRFYEAEIMFLRTFKFFWPLFLSNTSLNVVYDAELESSLWVATYKGTLSELAPSVPGGVKMTGIPSFPYYKSGYDRQQYDMFWADNFTNAEFVGFVDTDCAFITYIDREDLFENGKPVVNGREGIHPDESKAKWSNATYTTLGILEPFRTMSYFPVIIKTAHLPLIRNYIAKRHGKTFDEAFRDVIQVSERGYSQFNIMTTYLWAFHRDEYTWYIQSMTPDWDGLNPSPAYGQDGDHSQYTAQMRQPKPRIATHVNYRSYYSSRNRTHMSDIRDKHHKEMNEFMRQGYCYSPPFPHTEPKCTSMNPEKYYFEMHNFEGDMYESVFSADSLNHQAYLRYERLQHCTKVWNPDEVKAFMAD